MGNIRQLITANAGTGKTYSLTRHLAQLLKDGVKPDAIVALTFSRAAAGEIFQGLVNHLFKDGDTQTLRSLIAVQHLCTIGTIDSFLMKMIRSFPLELGLGGPVTIMGEYERGVALQDCLARALSSRIADPGEIIRLILAMFALAGKKSLRSTLDSFVVKMMDFYADNSEKKWGVNVVEEAFVECERRHLRLAAEFGSIREKFAGDARIYEGLGAIQNFIAGFGGRFDSKTPTPVKNLLAAADFGSMRIGKFNVNRRPIEFDADSARRVVEIFRSLLDEDFLLVSMKTDALGRFLKMVYAEYCNGWVDRGSITFSDMARLVNRLPMDARCAIEYRFDSKFEHWALDEFQDTSDQQWSAITNLVDETMQSTDGRSVYLVGDPKQAIYGWRGGNVDIFKEAISSNLFENIVKNESYRYVAPIAESLNMIFGNEELIRMVAVKSQVAADNWSKLWNRHRSSGTTGSGCFIVKELESRQASPEDRPLEQYVKIIDAELKRIKFDRRKINCAVLVRSGADGENIAEQLRGLGYRAVFEGNTGIFDIPAVSYLAELAAWAEHPESKHAKKLFAVSPLGECPLARPEVFLDSVTRIGLARTFRALIDSLPPEATSDRLVALRLDETIRAASKFEATGRGELRLDTFADFLEKECVGNAASADTIAVMTIHHSKGLTYDVAFFPVIESHGMDAVDAALLTGREWVLEHPDGFVVESRLYDKVYQAHVQAKAARVYEELCVNYVAMTRARKEMMAILPPPAQKSEALKFSNLIRATVGSEVCEGDDGWFESIAEFDRPGGNDHPGSDRTAGMQHFSGDRLSRTTPSSVHASEICADDIFSLRSASAAQRGIDFHAEMATVEFEKTRFGGALQRPDGLVELWRERAYELYDGEKNVWESGVFDRVVLVDADGGLEARIYDYKTDEPAAGETEDEFVSRLMNLYSAQLHSYRKAVKTLTNRRCKVVKTYLLVEKLDRCIEVKCQI